jgi:hypothetical protein
VLVAPLRLEHLLRVDAVGESSHRATHDEVKRALVSGRREAALEQVAPPVHRLDLKLQARVGLDEQAAPATTHLEEQTVAEALAIEGTTFDHQSATHAAQRRVDP